MNNTGKIMGILLGSCSVIAMSIFFLITMCDWLGLFFGIILSFILSPGLVIFPIIFWIVEGVFPTTYFIIWGIGIAGSIIFYISEAYLENR